MKEKEYSPQRLKDYALWYYFRYYPSNKKLLTKLKEKGSTDNAEKIFQKISNLLQEDEIIRAKIENYIFRNKNYRYIEQKMAEKLFPRDKVSQYLETYKNSWKSLLSDQYLEKKIVWFIKKGKSKNYILQKLWETPLDKEKIELFLNQNYKEDIERENILREYKKIKDKFPREKIIQKLLTKGFSYNSIKKSMSEDQETTWE